MKRKIKPTKRYLLTLGIFGIIFLFIILSPSLFGQKYSYPDTQVNEFQLLANNIQIAIVKKQFNPETGVMRIDYFVESELEASSYLANITYHAECKYITASNELEVETIRVNDNYFSVLVKQLPEKFEVLSVTIVPEYIHKEIEVTDNLNDRSLKMYINQSEKYQITGEISVSENVLRADYMDAKKTFLKMELEGKEGQISDKKLAIKQTKQIILDLKTETSYQTDMEKEETKASIEDHRLTIKKYESEIETIEAEKEELKERIRMLEEKEEEL